MGRLQGLVAAITGAGSGIGRASALEFGREGACVLVADVNAASAEETAEQVRGLDARAAAIQVDVTRPDDAERMIQSAVDRFGRLDVLFNNAGVGQTFTPVEESS